MDIYPIAEYVDQDITPLNILLFIVDKCNFECEYCYNRQPRHLDYAKLDIFLKYVKDISNKTQRCLNISLIGGEPTLHPEMESFCDELLLIPNTTVEILTNFSQPLEYYLRLLEKNIKLAATWHGKKKDKANLSYFSKMLKVPKQFFENNQIEIRIMFENDNWENSDRMFNYVYPIFKQWVEISLLQQNDGYSYPYSHEQRKIYGEYVKKLKCDRNFFTVEYSDGSKKKMSFNDMYFSDPLLSFHLWKCNAGLDYIYVHSDGNVYHCQSYYEHYFKPICNIYELNGEYQIDLYKPCICRAKYCSCDFDVKKEKILKNIK